MATQVLMVQAAHASHDPEASINITNFNIRAGDQKLLNRPTPTTWARPAPPLGVLENFSGNFSGNGLNMIFRPNRGPPTGTTFPKPVTPAPPTAPSENVLEINLTAETLNFGLPIGSVPNRGLGGQSDVFLNGVPYVQTINDVSNPLNGKADGPRVGIHFETGLWMHLPATTADPVLAASLVRMGSIPHGTTINAQTLEPTQTSNGPPQIPAVDITPFVVGSNPPTKSHFTAQDATKNPTPPPRIPQELTSFIAAGMITQDILTDPNTVVRNANAGKNISSTEVFTVSTTPRSPELGGGTANIAFLVGTTNAGLNANAASMSATFWINKVQTEIQIPGFPGPGGPPVRVTASEPLASARVPTFIVQPPQGHRPQPSRTITMTHTELQYSQVVNLNFAGLTWPHVSVNTLVPTAELHVPPFAL